MLGKIHAAHANTVEERLKPRNDDLRGASFAPDRLRLVLGSKHKMLR